VCFKFEFVNSITISSFHSGLRDSLITFDFLRALKCPSSSYTPIATHGSARPFGSAGLRFAAFTIVTVRLPG